MKQQGSSRRRRRSSARFLKMAPGAGNNDNNDNDNDDNDGQGGDGAGFGGEYDGSSTSTLTNLGEVYRNAIRMNAENRINASNSWNLNLIDHLDRFVAPELRSGVGGGSGGRHLQSMNNENGNGNVNSNYANTMMESSMDSTMISGVNFTKASCTLDASVKIYSYRVDDVHLTSYKVLANLNRTDNNTSSQKKNSATNVSVGNDDVDDDVMEGGSSSRTSSSKSRGNTNAADTLEQNTGAYYV